MNNSTKRFKKIFNQDKILSDEVYEGNSKKKYEAYSKFREMAEGFFKALITSQDVNEFRTAILDSFPHIPMLENVSLFIVKDHLEDLNLIKKYTTAHECYRAELLIELFMLFIRKSKKYSFTEIKEITCILYSQELFNILQTFSITSPAEHLSSMVKLNENFVNHIKSISKTEEEMEYRISYMSMMSLAFLVYYASNYLIHELDEKDSYSIIENTIGKIMKINYSQHLKDRLLERHISKDSIKAALAFLLMLPKNLEVGKSYGILISKIGFKNRNMLVVFSVKKKSFVGDIEISIITALSDYDLSSDDKSFSIADIDGIYFLLENPYNLIYVDIKYFDKSKKYAVDNGRPSLNEMGIKKFPELFDKTRNTNLV
jgi:hypothetical protein